jgi:Cyclic nucleotide-binding domain
MSNAATLSDHGSGMRISQRSSLILSRLPPQMTTQLFACAFKRAAKAGEALFVAGDRGDGCYRVEQGLVKITVTSDRGEERIIALVGEGEIIGELSLIDHQPRSASAIALCDSTFQYITRQAFEDCTKDDPAIYKQLAAILAVRRERPTRPWPPRASYRCGGVLPARCSNSRTTLARTRVGDAFCSTSGSPGRTWLPWPEWRARTSVAS